MNRKTILHRVAQGCGVCLPLLLSVGLLVPGCAGNRGDMLSSLIKPKQSTPESKVAEADEEDSTSLIAGADSRKDPSRLSAFSDEEIIEGRPKLRHRVRSLFSRKSEVQAAGDPFLNSDEAQPGDDAEDPAQDRKAIAGSDNSRVEELLASFQTTEADQPADADKAASGAEKPWWEAGSGDQAETTATNDNTAAGSTAAAGPQTTFSHQFDSRLERLRAELDLGAEPEKKTDDPLEVFAAPPPTAQEQPKIDIRPTIEPRPTIAGRKTARQSNPFAETNGRAEDLPIVAGNGTAENAYPSLMTEPRSAGTTRATAAAETPDAAKIATDAKARVRALMADAQQDWEAWRLHRAYQTVVAAHKLAVRENVRFAEGEQQPRDLARKIVADLKKDSLPARADKPRRALANNPFKETDDLGIRSAAATFGFDELDRLAKPWTAKEPAKATGSGTPEPTVAQSAKPAAKAPAESTRSGVSLLPPDDDFPSDAQERDWTHADPRDIRLATHKFPQFSRPDEKTVRDQLHGLTAEENRALLQNVADQKNRVLTSNAIRLPELPAGYQSAPLDDGTAGPIRIAQAPRVTLEDDLAIAAAPGPGGPAGSDAAGGSLLGQFWLSQPIWFIGGLVLLIIALRLWPWSKPEDA